MFDDDRVGLDKEPFVGGADTLIDLAVEQKGIENADGGFLMLFSATPFPGVTFTLNGCARRWVVMFIYGARRTRKVGCSRRC